jgi:hypothetical protein
MATDKGKGSRWDECFILDRIPTPRCDKQSITIILVESVYLLYEVIEEVTRGRISNIDYRFRDLEGRNINLAPRAALPKKVDKMCEFSRDTHHSTHHKNKGGSFCTCIATAAFFPPLCYLTSLCALFIFRTQRTDVETIFFPTHFFLQKNNHKICTRKGSQTQPSEPISLRQIFPALSSHVM